MNNKQLTERLEKQLINIKDKTTTLLLIKNELKEKQHLSLGVVKKIVRYYPELLYLFKENKMCIFQNIEQELSILQKTFVMMESELTTCHKRDFQVIF